MTAGRVAGLFLVGPYMGVFTGRAREDIFGGFCGRIDDEMFYCTKRLVFFNGCDINVSLRSETLPIYPPEQVNVLRLYWTNVGTFGWTPRNDDESWCRTRDTTQTVVLHVSIAFGEQLENTLTIY